MGAPSPVVSFDHIALAVPDINEALDQLQLRLGATIISGDEVPDYRFAMTRIGDATSGMNLELLEPRQAHADNFLHRFLQRHGAGPHHITFLQPDLGPTIDELRGREYRLVGTKLNFGPWQESFIHPSHGCGTVVQIAGSTIPTPPMEEMLAAAHAGERPPAVPYDERSQNQFWWAQRHPSSSSRSQAALKRIVIRVQDLDLVRDLFVDVLKGEVLAEDPKSIEVTWGATGRIRFTESPEARVEAFELSSLAEEFSFGAADFRYYPGTRRSCSHD